MCNVALQSRLCRAFTGTCYWPISERVKFINLIVISEIKRHNNDVKHIGINHNYFLCQRF